MMLLVFSALWALWVREIIGSLRASQTAHSEESSISMGQSL